MQFLDDVENHIQSPAIRISVDGSTAVVVLLMIDKLSKNRMMQNWDVCEIRLHEHA